MPRLITRYDNRKLYDLQERRYVTIDELARMIAGGTDVTVQDRKTSRDITNVVLAQVILEGVRDDRWGIPGQVLTRLIRVGALEERIAALKAFLAPAATRPGKRTRRSTRAATRTSTRKRTQKRRKT